MNLKFKFLLRDCLELKIRFVAEETAAILLLLQLLLLLSILSLSSVSLSCSYLVAYSVLILVALDLRLSFILF